jgi:hypothetical protein
MNKEKESQAQKFENAREHFRNKSRSAFLGVHEKSHFLVVSLNEVVARHLYYAESRTLNHIENGDYYGKLIVSFTRTHFVLYDLIICNELIDAAVLFRKQLELVSRLVELEEKIDVSKLIKNTPKVNHLEFDLNRLYSAYSEITHSADPNSMDLLGSINAENGLYTSVFPRFDEDSYVSFYHLFLLVTQYHYWIADKYEKWFEGYSRDEDCKIYKKCYEAFNQIYYENPKFKRIGKS